MGKPRKAIVVNCNDDSSYDVELLGDSSISIGLLEEELFEFVEEPAPLERKHKDVLYRFARKILAKRNIKKIDKRQTELGKLILKISKSLEQNAYQKNWIGYDYKNKGTYSSIARTF